MYPRNMGDNQAFREDFLNVQAVTDNGGTIAGAPIFSSVSGVTLDGIADRIDYDIENIINQVIGTIRIIANIDADDENSHVPMSIGASGTVTTFFINYNMSTNVLRAGLAVDNTTQWTWESEASWTDDKIGVNTEITIVQDGTEPKIYINGVENTNGSFTTSLDKTKWFVDLRDATGPATTLTIGNYSDTSSLWFAGKVKTLEFFDSVWTADEALDAFENDTYSEVDFGKAIVYLPMISQYNDGSQKTVNKGTLSDSIVVGDGSTASTFPTAIGIPPRSFDFDGGDYLKDVTANFQSSDTEGTIIALLKTNVIGTNSIFSSADEADTIRFFSFSTDSVTNVLRVDQRNGDTQDTVKGTTVINPGQWYVVTLTSSGVAYKLFVDENEEEISVTSGANSGDWLADTDNRDNSVWGALIRSSISTQLDGQMKDGLYFDFELTPRQIRWVVQKLKSTFNL